MRKQVELDLGTPALNPTVQRAGQYRVAVQQTPKTNSALQLAQALRVTPQILGQANNIAKDLGAEAAAEVLDVEAAMNNDETRGILGYDKAYQQGLVKRHFAMNEEAIKERFMNLARTEDALKQTPEEFLGAMAGERKQFVDELMEQFGGNENREQAITALSGAFVDELRDAATAEFVQNKKDQALMMISADTQTLFNNQGVAAGLDYMASEMSAVGVDLKPSERAQRMRDAVTSNVAVAIEQGQFSKAQQIINDAEAYGIKGAGKLFGSTKGLSDMKTVKASLRKAVEANEVSFSDNSKGVERSVDALMQDIADINVSPEDRSASALRMAKRAGVSDEDAQAFAEEVASGSIDDFIRAYRDLARNATNENTRDLLNDQLGEINRAKKEYFGGSASTIGTFSADDMGELEASIREVLDRNPSTSRTNLPMSVNGRKVNFQDPDYIEMMNRINRDYEWATIPSQKGSIIREAQKDIRGGKGVDGFGDYANEYAVAISTELDEAAPSLYRQAKGDVAVYEGLLQDKVDKLKAEYKRRADLRANTESLLDVNLSVTKEAEAQEEASDSKTVRDLKSFSGQATVSDVVNDRKALQALETSRRGLSKEDKRRLLQASLLDYGFPTIESLDLNLLAEARMGFEDVFLGDAVLREMIPASNGHFAKENGMEVTSGQQEAMDRWTEFGFDSYDDFSRIEEAQETLRNLNNR